jgi:hypothetical protein
MRKIINLALGIIAVTLFCSFFNLIFGESFSTKRKMAFQIGRNLSKHFKNKYGFEFIGVSEEAENGKYKTLGLEFSCPFILTKDQGRVFLLECKKKVLHAYNSYPPFRQYMANYPFDGNNIIFKIFIQPKKILMFFIPILVFFHIL